MLNRGFIGPIGDDLPSLIPILFGLVIFFSTFTLAFNSFDDRNTEFKDDLEVMRISRIMQSNSYIFSEENFQELCSQVGLVKLKYAAIITEDAVKGNKINNLFEITAFKNQQGEGFFCTNLEDAKVSNPVIISDFFGQDEISDAKIVSRIYPIVVEDDKIVKPMHLVVVAWK